MEIVVPKIDKITIYIGDREDPNCEKHEVREPTVDDLNILAQSKDQNDKAKGIDDLKSFLIAIGMPAQRVNTMGAMTIKALVEGFTDSFNQKGKSEG